MRESSCLLIVLGLTADIALANHTWRVWEKMRSSLSGWMTERASVCIWERVRDGDEGWGGNKSRTGTDCRVRGGRDSEVERISERESRAEGGGRWRHKKKGAADAWFLLWGGGGRFILIMQRGGMSSLTSDHCCWIVRHISFPIQKTVFRKSVIKEWMSLLVLFLFQLSEQRNHYSTLRIRGGKKM